MRSPMLARFLLGFMAVFLAACDVIDPAGPPLLDCAVWASCPGALAIHTEVLQSGFRRQRPDRYMPGDSFVVRVRVQNRAKVASDSLFVSYEGVGFAAYRALGDSVTRPGGWRHPVLVLGAGKTYEVIDTAVVAGFTFDRATRLVFSVADWVTSDSREFQSSGTVEFPIATSGYKFEGIMGPPGPLEVVQHGSHTHNATLIRHKTETGVLVRISNPYELPLQKMSIGHCLWDGDHGYVCESKQVDMAPLQTGSETHVEYVFKLDTEGHYHDWWGRTFTDLSVCPESGFAWSEQCIWAPILITANFEADCTVLDAPIGVLVRDETPECGRWKDGSAYRFTARKGERYKVSLVSAAGGEVFLSPRDGVSYSDPRVTEMVIPEDGVYYVVVRHTSATRFRLDKEN